MLPLLYKLIDRKNRNGSRRMYIITTGNGKYIQFTDTGSVTRVTSKKLASGFPTMDAAIYTVKCRPSKLKGCIVMDSDTGKIVYRSHSKIKVNRRKFSQKTRMGLYKKSNGRCAICGKKLSIEEMTVDHIKPVAAGGNNDMENLQCCCKTCNFIKGNLLQGEFYSAMSRIFMFQMDRRYHDRLVWKMMSKVICKLVTEIE